MTRRLVPMAALLVACGSSSDRSPRLADLELGGGGASGAGGGASGAAGAGGAISVGPPPIGTSVTISASPDSSAEAEPSLAVAPGGAVGVVWIDFVLGDAWYLGYALSPDGIAFSPPAKLESPGGARAADPVIVADGSGAFHVVWLAYPPGNTAQARVFVARAAPGSSQFDAPEEVSDAGTPGAYDKPFMTITSSGARLVSYTRAAGGIAVARSTAPGVWSRFSVVPDGAQAELSAPCVPSSGTRAYLTYVELGGTRLRWSDDDGATWPAANQTTVSEPADGVPPLDPPTCVAQGDEVAVVYGVTKEGSSVTTTSRLTQIRVAHSSSQGKTVDRQIVAHDPQAGPYYVHPGLARAADGSLHALYYAGAVSDGPGTLRHAWAPAGGAFGPSAVARDGLAFVTSRTSVRWPGDYLSVGLHDGTLFAAYVDNTGPAAHVAVYRVAPGAP